MDIADSNALTWLFELLNGHLDGDVKVTDRYPAIRPGEQTVLTQGGLPLRLSEFQTRTEYLLRMLENSPKESDPWASAKREREIHLLRIIFELELTLKLKESATTGGNRQIAFRKGGIIVWRADADDPAE